MSKSLMLLAGFTLIEVLCLGSLFSSGMSNGDKQVNNVTFNKDVAPILFNKCVECHRAGEVAPMSLLSYKEARPWARSIKEKVLAREMPPWHADPHFGEFANDRRLTKEEIATIVAWVDTGAKEGAFKDLPPLPRFVDGWNIDKPDLILTAPEEIILKASGTDEYHYFELPANFTEDKYVQMAELQPSNHRVAHHITAFIIAPPPGADGRPQSSLSREEIEKIRAEMEKGSIFFYEGVLSRVKPDVPVYDDGCMLPSGGGGINRDGGGQNWTSLATPLAIYSPGVNPSVYRLGTARKIPAGSKIIFQAHYWKPEGKVDKDRPMIGLVFAKVPPQKEVFTQLIINNYFKIPPGVERHRVSACWTTEQDVHIISFMPHMHWRGAAMTIEAFYPDGRSEVLLNVPNYSFSWQTVYYLKELKAIPKGTKVKVTANYDNSTKNKHNPDPTKAVRAGEPTYDEMMAGFVDYTIDSQNMRSTRAKLGSNR
jgi:hypothetical protein